MKSNSTPLLARPLFCVVTAAATDNDREAARGLGTHLYGLLTRDIRDPLSHGAAIPVLIDAEPNGPLGHEVLEQAEVVLLLVVAGTSAALLEPNQILDGLSQVRGESRDAGPWKNSVKKWIVPTDPRWLGLASDAPGIQVIQSIYRPESEDAAIDEILVAVGKSFRRETSKPTLFLADSHQTLPDPSGRLFLKGCGGLAGANASLLNYFGRVIPLDGVTTRSSHSLLTSAPRGEGVLVAIRGEGASSRAFEQHVIAAKQWGMPVVMVDGRAEPMQMESPYLGNVPELAGHVSLPKVLRVAVIEHLRYQYFHRSASQLIEAAGLPLNTAVIAKAPELLDVHGGVLSGTTSRVVLHPDPPLPSKERELFHKSAPLMHAVTPSTLLGRSHGSAGRGRLVTPLDGIRVGFSISDILAGDYRSGLTELHLQDAVIQIARTLISGGASLAYGGDFSLGHTTSFTHLFAQLMSAYHRTASGVRDRLHLFLPATSSLGEIPEQVECIARHLSKSKTLAERAAFSPRETTGLPPGAFLSDMRRLMVREIQALVVVGGKARPKQGDAPGYTGRFPGVAEEVFRAVEVEHPVYVCGGFGGMAARIAELFQVPESSGDAWSDANYAGNAEYMKTVWNFDHFKGREALKLPRNLTELATVIRDFARKLGDDDTAWCEWNGLTRAQNERLWSTSHPGLLSALIADGLIRWRGLRGGKERRCSVEVIRGDVTDITRADLLAIPVFSDVDPQGPGAAVDVVTGGAVRQGQSRPDRLLGVQSEQLDVDYLMVVSLGKISESNQDDALRDAIVSSIRKTVDECLRQGLSTLGLVTFGGSTMSRYDKAVSAMIEGLGKQPGGLTIKWVERDEQKFQTLVNELRKQKSMDVTTVVQPMVEPTWQPYSWFHVTVLYEEKTESLSVTALPASGNGLAWSQKSRLTTAELEQLSAGDANGKRTPDWDELGRRGERLATLMLGKNASVFFRDAPDAKIAITHDAASSRLPFETLRIAQLGDSDTSSASALVPAIQGGMHRRLLVNDARAEQVLSRPKLSGRLRIGLVIDPTNDLPGARKEGEYLCQCLSSLKGDVQIDCLRYPHTTLEQVQDMLQSVDVFHYCGHAQFDPKSPAFSGLKLHEGKMLTSENLRTVSPMPRVAIFNACEAGRVRGEKAVVVSDAYSFAEFVLRAGVEAFVGTFWEVLDTAAAEFAVSVYKRLLERETVRDAVTSARRELAEKGHHDWANYLLYGDGQVRFV